MTESIADMVHRRTDEIGRAEYALVERLIAAYIEETGRFPLMAHDDCGRWWCNGTNDFLPSAEDVRWAAKVAGVYLAETDIPASRAMLVREFDGAAFSWRWEERK